MTESTSIGSTKSLPHIPFEILTKIAQHLDLSSAARLSRTCKALRDAGELRVWATVDITSGYDSSNPACPELAAITDYRNRQTTVKQKVQNALSALKSYPFRQECISTLRLEPSDGSLDSMLSNDLLALLEKVSAQIKQLHILPLPYEDSWTEGERLEFGHSLFDSRAAASDANLSKVAIFKWACGDDAIHTFDTWMKRMPNLEELEVCSAEELYEHQTPRDMTWPSLQHLKRLTFDHLDDTEYECSAQFLAKLLETAPNLECVRIRGQWAPNKKDPALRAMSKLEKLKRVILVDEDGIDFERVGRIGLRIEEAVAQDDGMDESLELTFENLVLPRLPNLQRLTVLTSPRMSLEDYKCLPVTSLHETGHLSSIFLKYIRRTPLLDTVFFHFLETPFPSAYDPSPVEPEYIVSPDRWEAEGYRGAIVRQYKTFSMSGAEEFWHIRTISRAVDHPSGPSYVGLRRHWRDFTHYKGRTVPRHILDEVYEAAGLEADLAFLAGGRDLSLGEGSASWRILREWRETAGDESDIEDDFSDEDAEETDDDDLDDDDMGDDGLADIWGLQAEDGGDDWVDTDDDGLEDDDDDPLGMW